MEMDGEIVAIVSVFNEADILAHSLGKLVAQGIGIYLIDNWSTDGSLEIAREALGGGLVGWERFPAEGPDGRFSLKSLLRRTEDLQCSLGARWYIHQDVDEIRDSPWPGVDLRAGIERVEREGYNCINHVCLIFRPVDESFVPGSDPEAHFRYFEPGHRPGHFVQEKAWRFPGTRVDLASSGGHSVAFPGKRVYPVPFLLKHYPIRGRAHGLRKILTERRSRFDPEERALGWHQHYDGFDETSAFRWDPAALRPWDEAAVKQAVARGEYAPPALS